MDTRRREPRVLFRVAAGPRVGFGHLVRATSLARALGVRPWLSIRGPERSAGRTARRLGARVAEGTAREALERTRPDVVVIDDRVASATRAWRRAVRQTRIPLVSIHDLGIGLGEADLVVDGSIAPAPVPPPALLGPRYAILSVEPGAVRATGDAASWDVVITLGGGPRRVLARRLALDIVRKRPGARVAVAAGFCPPQAGVEPDAFTWLEPAGLLDALASTATAIVAGGVTLYEALSLGVPSIAVAVVPSQLPTIHAFAEQGAALDGGLLPGQDDVRAAARKVADLALRLLEDTSRRRALARKGRGVVDGRGADRVAAEIRRLASRGRARKAGPR